MTTHTEHYDGNEMSLIAHKIDELESKVKTHGSFEWDAREDPDVDERLGNDVILQMMKRGFLVNRSPSDTVNISRKK